MSWNGNRGIDRRVGERGSLIRIAPKPEFPTEKRIVHPRRVGWKKTQAKFPRNRRKVGDIEKW